VEAGVRRVRHLNEVTIMMDQYGSEFIESIYNSGARFSTSRMTLITQVRKTTILLLS
jgi:hypothetical protein